jgi:hypothetical protein
MADSRPAQLSHEMKTGNLLLCGLLQVAMPYWEAMYPTERHMANETAAA